MPHLNYEDFWYVNVLVRTLKKFLKVRYVKSNNHTIYIPKCKVLFGYRNEEQTRGRKRNQELLALRKQQSQDRKNEIEYSYILQKWSGASFFRNSWVSFILWLQPLTPISDGISNGLFRTLLYLQKEKASDAVFQTCDLDLVPRTSDMIWHFLSDRQER